MLTYCVLFPSFSMLVNVVVTLFLRGYEQMFLRYGTNKAQLGELSSFPGVPYRSAGEGLLTEAEMTHRQLHHKTHPSMGDGSQSWEPEALCVAYGSMAGWRASFPGGSPRPLGWCDSVSQQSLLLLYAWGGRAQHIRSFSGTSCLKGPPCRVECMEISYTAADTLLQACASILGQMVRT